MCKQSLFATSVQTRYTVSVCIRGIRALPSLPSHSSADARTHGVSAQDFLSNPLSMATHFLSSLFGGGASSGILGMPGLPGLPAGMFGGSSAAAESAPGLPAAGPAPSDTLAFIAAWAPESAPSAQGAPAPLAPAHAAGAAHMAHKHVHAHVPHAKQADAAAPAAAHWDHIVEAVHRMGAARWDAARARLATSTPARRLLREGGPADRTSGRAAASLHRRMPVSSGCPSCVLAASCSDSHSELLCMFKEFILSPLSSLVLRLASTCANQAAAERVLTGVLLAGPMLSARTLRRRHPR
jgi:hypothetical protein